MRKLISLLILLLITACVPATAIPNPTATSTPELLPPTSEQVPLATDVPAEAPTTKNPLATPEPEPTPTHTPAPTKSAWELAQEQVSRLRNLLDSYSDGYNGLSMALEQTGPNKDWCDGLTIAINDFDYIKDTESSETLQALKEAQGCP